MRSFTKQEAPDLAYRGFCGAALPISPKESNAEPNQDGTRSGPGWRINLTLGCSVP
jgi:hypothetical protein